MAVPYNSTSPTGGDSLTQNLNVFYEGGDIAWMITATALVLLMIPGVGFFYSGLARRKNALSLIFLSMMAIAIVSFQWFFFGYSLAFSHTAGPFIGDFANVGFLNVLAAPSVGSDSIPDLMFAIYQGMFAAITAALAVGAAAERGRLLPALIFVFIWTTIVYDVIADWTWNVGRGWVSRLGGLDFAGGTPVHISSGMAALAYSLMLKKRKGYGTRELNFRPHNITHIVIGTVFLWVGWFGFNAGSALGANLRAVMAAVVTNLAASVAGITWAFVDWCSTKRWSMVGFCSGVIAGLVAVTPASGFIPPWSSFVVGVVAGVGCNFGTRLKHVLGIDDALDIFSVHAIGGFIGDLLTGLFAADYIVHLDGSSTIPGGWVNHHWIQLAYQFTDGVTGGAYSFVVSLIILKVLDLVPGLHLRATTEEEIMGMDDVEMGEFAYDYVELTRDVVSSEHFAEMALEADDEDVIRNDTRLSPHRMFPGRRVPVDEASSGKVDSEPDYRMRVIEKSGADSPDDERHEVQSFDVRLPMENQSFGLDGVSEEVPRQSKKNRTSKMPGAMLRM